MLDTQALADRCHARMLADPLRCNARITFPRYSSDLDRLTAFREALADMRDVVERIADAQPSTADRLYALVEMLDEAQDCAGSCAEDARHRYEPHPKHPWCRACGYSIDNRLIHFPPDAPASEGGE